MFFRNTESNYLPTCAQANEYLAEDRIMCLQIYVKSHSRYNIQYVPDAKAFTDAPADMCTLMKQRRRWMNGALFGTTKVLANFFRLLGCGTKHTWYENLLIFIFLPYLLAIYLLNYFLVGSLFVTIAVFFGESLILLTGATVDQIRPYYLAFVWSYFMMLVLTVFVCLSLPIDRAMTYLKVITFIICTLFLTSLSGICYYMSQEGFYTEEYVYNKHSNKWIPTGQVYLNFLVVAGTVVLLVYFVPFIYRPLDFAYNFVKYIVGFICYMMLLPMFSNVF